MSVRSAIPNWGGSTTVGIPRLTILNSFVPPSQLLPDFAFGTKFAPKDDAGMEKKKVSELLNGRLAMIAVGGIATQSIISGHGFPYV